MIADKQKQLLQNVQEIRILAQKLLAEDSILKQIDSLERHVKQPGKIQRHFRNPYVKEYEELHLLEGKLNLLYLQKHQRLNRQINLLILPVIPLVLCYYLVVSIKDKFNFTDTPYFIVWLFIGVLLTSLLVGYYILHTHVWNFILIQSAPYLIRRKPIFGRIYLYFYLVFSFFLYLNTGSLVIDSMLNQLYPFIFLPLINLAYGAIQLNIASLMNSFFLVLGNVATLFSVVGFLFKIIRKRLRSDSR